MGKTTMTTIKTKKSGVTKSLAFEKIMKSFESYGKMLPAEKFWREVVFTLDPNISLRQWTWFYNKNLKGMAVECIEKSREVQTKLINYKQSDEDGEKDSLSKILKIANITLDEVIEDPEKLAQIPPKMRIEWLFSAMKARDSRMTVILKKKENDRKETMFEELIKGAQYGSITEGEISEHIEEADEETESMKQFMPVAPAPEKEVKFDPTQL